MRNGEQREIEGTFDSPEYVMDAATLDVPKGWIVIGHNMSEESGMQEMADWLDDDKKPHQCNFDHACLGAEIMMAMQSSAVEGGQISLPLTNGLDEQALLNTNIADRPVLVSFEQNKKEFGLA